MNADGRTDILTGSYNPGHLYFFKQNEDGTYAKGETLKYADGEDLIVGSASTPFAVDWDGDDDLDLLVGDIRGHAWFVEKTDKGFIDAVKLQHDGKDLSAEHGDSQPVAVDWNGDGTLDLMFPHGNGRVDVYPGIASEAGIVLGKPEVLIEEPGKSRSATGAAEGAENVVKPGTRAKVHVTDVDGDGSLDILLGDFGTKTLPPPDMTEEEKKEFDELSKQREAITEKLLAVYKEIMADVEKGAGKPVDEMTDEEKMEYYNDLREKLMENDDYKELSKQSSEIGTKLRKYQPQREYRGNVWLFKGKKPVPTTGKSEG